MGQVRVGSGLGAGPVPAVRARSRRGRLQAAARGGGARVGTGQRLHVLLEQAAGNEPGALHLLILRTARVQNSPPSHSRGASCLVSNTKKKMQFTTYFDFCARCVQSDYNVK